MKDYDLSIIGAGWAGFNAALRAKELGLKVCLIEKAQIGGTCLNLGCIPTKTLIQSAKVYSLTKKAQNFGLESLSPQINFSKVQESKAKIIQQLRSGMQFGLKGIDFINADAQIISQNRIKAGQEILDTNFILIATGSRPLELSAIKFDGKKVLSSDQILGLREIPGSLLIIGGGVIGCEFANLFSIFGTKVTIVEKMMQLLPGEDIEIAKKLETLFKKRGLKISTNTDAASINLADFDLALLCVGRTPNIEGLELEKLGVKAEKGRVIVDETLKTNIPNIYAAGDCTGRIMLAHFSAYQGKLAVENMVNPNNVKKSDESNIPNCIFTDPEIASVGLSEEKAKNKVIEVKIHKFDFLGSGMARILNETEGFIKIVSEQKTGQILGASIIGPKATELIGIFSLALTNNLNLYQIKQTIFAHPTLSESISEALR